MKISVIQQKFEFGYDHEGEPPSLEMLTARAAAESGKRIIGFPRADEFVGDSVPCGIVHG